MVEEETTQDQPESEVPQDQDAADPRLVSRETKAEREPSGSPDEPDEDLESWILEEE